MNSTWPDALSFTLQQEGLYFDDPRAGPTWKGITLSTYRDYQDDQDLTADDLRAASPTDIANVYRTRFWDGASCATFGTGLDLMVFDHAVNTGIENSLYLVQRAVGVTVDGEIGPKTLAAIGQFSPLRVIEIVRQQQWRYYGEVHDASAELIQALRNRLARRVYAAHAVLAKEHVG